MTGIAVDATGAVLPSADVELLAASKLALKTTTDGSGTFRFDGVAPGRYDVSVAFEGFQTTTVRVTVGTRAPSPVRVTLPLANVTQEITVSNQTPEVNATATSNSDAVTIDQNMLESLPVFDQDLIASVSRFLDAGALGNAGATVVVNGMEVSALRVSASAVQQIKINQDPYSAEYARPGRGRIEILTKPGSAEYHGEANVFFRDAMFDAANAFATTKPADRKHIVEGVLGGPVGGGTKTSFLLSGHDQVEDQQAFVYAVGLNGVIQDQASQPNRQSLLAGSITHLKSDTTTISIRPNYEYESNTNRGVGGTTLATAGTNFEHREEQVTYTQQTVIRPTLLGQFQILVGHEREPTVSVSSDRGIVVSGAFTGGGAQGDLLRTETHMQSTASLAWTTGQHLVQTGFQLPDWSRRGFYDRTNFGGTFYFASLAAYGAGQPYAFIQQQGNGDLAFLEKQVGTYVKDDWQMKPGVTLSLGLRYDWQNYFHDTNNFAPRMSLAYAPGKNKTNVFRVGAGFFNDRSGPVAIADLLHYQPGGLTKAVITNPSYPDPFVSATATTEPPSIVRLAPDVQIPRTLQYSAGVDHQLSKATTLSITYTGAHGYHLFRSRDINAPLPPLYASRPDPTYTVVREIESDGRQQTDSLSVTLRGRFAKWFTGQAQYALSRAYNDTNGIAWFPANDYDLSGEYGRADFDRRHRLGFFGRLSPRSIVDIGVSLTMNSAGPYTELLGQDIFNNGRGRARPIGVARNTLEGAGFASLDLRVSRDLKFTKDRALTVGVDVFNVTNHVNYATFVGTLGSPLFAQPVSSRAPRQLQFSARLKF
ncbi:MAG TPA: carboxypeptidase regulatory-like domain-containing protein [Vicinamibacterales bacterium]|nr:carboxypeptidase regulatory-like domain-containing protein [Vicinamibacterales bacterium]